MIKAVFFDVGNVVLSNCTVESFHENLSSFLGLKYDEIKPKIDKIINTFIKGQTTEREFWQKLFQTFKISPKKGYNEFIQKEFRDSWILNKETIEIVKSVKAAGYKIAVISNTIKPHVEYMKRKGWYEPFSVLILSSEVGMKKPEVGIYKLALKKLRVKGSESIFIDDKKKNLVTAKKVGMKTIHFRSPSQLEIELKKLRVI